MSQQSLQQVAQSVFCNNTDMWNEETWLLSTPQTYYVTVSTALALGFVLFSWVTTSSKSVPLPWVNRTGWLDLFSMRAKYRFLMGARDMVLQGFKDHGHNIQGFRMVADSGEIVMLSPKYAAELKNDHRVDFVKLFLQVWVVGLLLRSAVLICCLGLP